MSSEQHTPVTHSSSNNYYIIWHKHVSTSTAELCYWYVINWHDLIYSRRHMRHVTSQTVSPKWALKSQALGGRKLGPQPQSSIVCGLCLVDLAPLYMTWPLFVEEETWPKCIRTLTWALVNTLIRSSLAQCKRNCSSTYFLHRSSTVPGLELTVGRSHSIQNGQLELNWTPSTKTKSLKFGHFRVL